MTLDHHPALAADLRGGDVFSHGHDLTADRWNVLTDSPSRFCHSIFLVVEGDHGRHQMVLGKSLPVTVWSTKVD